MIDRLDNMRFKEGISSVYDFGYNTNEALSIFFKKLNECIDVSNESNSLLTWLKEEGVKQEVNDTLTDWKEKGILEELINVLLFASLTDKIDLNKINITKLNEVLTQLKTDCTENFTVIDDNFSEVNNNINENVEVINNAIALINSTINESSEENSSKFNQINEDAAFFRNEISSLKDKTKRVNYIINNSDKLNYISHRGFSTKAPENTLSAYKLSGMLGYKYVECDIQETSDNQFILMHDETLDRTTTGTGEILSKTLNNIRSYKIDGGVNADLLSDTNVPTLQDFLTVCNKYSLIPIMELKAVKESSIQSFLNIVKEYGFIDKCMIISFKNNLIEQVRKLNKNIEICYLTRTFNRSEIDYCYKNEFNIGCEYGQLSKELCDYAHSKNLMVNSWTINSLSNLENAVNCGVDFITTDNILNNKLVKIFEETPLYSLGKHDKVTGKVYESCYGQSSASDITRAYSRNYYSCSDFMKFKFNNIPSGVTATLSFFDENLIALDDIGWIDNGVVTAFPSKAKYFVIYFGNGSVNFTYDNIKTFRNVSIDVL